MTQSPGALPLTDGVVALDRFTDADVDSLWAGEDDEYVHLSCLPGPFTRQDITSQIHDWQMQWELGGSRRSFAIRDAGTRRLVGGCVLDLRTDDGAIAELSYWVFPPYRRRGYATRSVALVCRYGFDTLGIARVELHITPTNDASQRVATKAGFLQKGLLRQEGLGVWVETIDTGASSRASSRAPSPAASSSKRETSTAARG